MILLIKEVTRPPRNLILIGKENLAAHLLLIQKMQSPSEDIMNRK